MSTSPLLDRKIRAILIICWLLMATLQAYALDNFAFDWFVACIDSVVNNLLLASACFLIANNLRFYRPEKDRFIYITVWCLLLSFVVVFLTYEALYIIFSAKADYLVILPQTLSVRFGLAFLTIGWIALISILWYTQHEQREQQQRKIDAEKLAREAELYKLRQQLQPHFLFNSLNSISALVGSRPEEARKMLHQLSDFLRGTLKKEEEQWVSLKEELLHLQLYLSIEKVRFGHRLSTSVTCDEPCNKMMIPPMLLQPVVENAIKFGLYDTIEDVVITIQAEVHENLLIVSVQNPFDPQTAVPRQGTGFGLSGVQRRLYLLFGRNDLLEAKAEGEMFTTILKIPQA